MDRKYIVVSIGHTAAGKTTLLRNISSYLDYSFISEGAIKRSLVDDYQNKCSVDEELRSRGYRIAISKAVEALSSQHIVVLDASFHKLFRRLWVYDELSKNGISDAHIIWINCVCGDRSKVENRIYLRSISPVKDADNQADKMFIYDYIMREFDDVNISDFPDVFDSSVIYVDTDNNKISTVSSTAPTDDILLQIINYINNSYFSLFA